MRSASVQRTGGPADRLHRRPQPAEHAGDACAVGGNAERRLRDDGARRDGGGA
jgi:hypothetical protein